MDNINILNEEDLECTAEVEICLDNEINENHCSEICGEIYLSKYDNNLVFNCRCCSKNFLSIELFSNHIFNNYWDNEGQENENNSEIISTNKDVTTDICNEEEVQTEQHQTVLNGYGVLRELESRNKENEERNLADLENENDKELEEEEEEEDDIKQGAWTIIKIESEELNSLISQYETSDEIHQPGWYDEPINLTEEDDPSEVNHHFQISERSYECTKCTKKFQNKQHLRNHERRGTCGSTIVKQSSLNQHEAMPSNTRKLKFQCSQCKKYLSTKSNIKRHMKLSCKRDRRRNDAYRCSDCHKYFFTVSELMEHKCSAKLNQRYFSCKFCEKKFNLNSDRETHERFHINEQLWYCYKCSNNFTSRAALDQHLKEHIVPTTNYQCKECNRYLISKYNLKRHLESHHIRRQKMLTEKVRYNCSFCPKNYKNKKTLTKHEKVHKIKVEYPCDLCDRSFFSLKELSAHYRNHTGEKQFTCERCGKDFISFGFLTIHEKLSCKKNAYQYKCDVCGKVFRLEKYLTRHKNVYCNKPVKTSSRGKKEFKCKICFNTFARKYNLQRHTKNVHLRYSSF